MKCGITEFQNQQEAWRTWMPPAFIFCLKRTQSSQLVASEDFLVLGLKPMQSHYARWKGKPNRLFYKWFTWILKSTYAAHLNYMSHCSFRANPAQVNIVMNRQTDSCFWSLKAESESWTNTSCVIPGKPQSSWRQFSNWNVKNSTSFINCCED